jgi:hypothetical protein
MPAFVSHLEKRDKVDGTSHVDMWRSGLIHGPCAPFTVPYDGEACASDSEVREEPSDMEMDAAPDPQRDTVIALAAARVAATAVANVLAAARSSTRPRRSPCRVGAARRSCATT